MVTFVDGVTLHLRAGKGGNGCVSVKREKFKPLAGPDGGNGGHGGDIVLVADPQVTTLLSYHHSPHRSAGNGGFGMGDHRSGAVGEDLELLVPVGTVVKDASGETLVDMIEPGMRFVVAPGGIGGLGNATLANPKRKAPGFALLGTPGWEGDVQLELKTVADVALVGFPSAGKSSLIAAISAARPKIADYPFTTLHPNLGVVQAGDVRYTVADVPGLIEGASEGKGLGLEFLRHVERCTALVHVLDCATLEPGATRSPTSTSSSPSSLRTPCPRARCRCSSARSSSRSTRSTCRRRRISPTSCAPISRRAGSACSRSRPSATKVCASSPSPWPTSSPRTAPSCAATPAPERIVIRPKGSQKEFTIRVEGGTYGDVYRILGEKPVRWVQQTDFQNEEAVGYLADRLEKLGVEDAAVPRRCDPRRDGRHRRGRRHHLRLGALAHARPPSS